MKLPEFEKGFAPVLILVVVVLVVVALVGGLFVVQNLVKSGISTAPTAQSPAPVPVAVVTPQPQSTPLALPTPSPASGNYTNPFDSASSQNPFENQNPFVGL